MTKAGFYTETKNKLRRNNIIADFDNNRFASKNQEYATPWELFNKINEEFNFTLDVCADESNHKVDTYFTEKQNALIQNWEGVCWMNPPYKDMKKWVIKAKEMNYT
ncbi:MAG: DNA N-6-adenine-methyltransferase (Dam) [Candidatus Methanofastidiosum methylothiophilum]|nr:MAG: DNA N-6-adenine-methyltransferase (Dam) [Candidatus Methanofastidiosum methylthiophilus]